MKKEQGITLLALLITIIILIILAGVALATLKGRDNIIKQAEGTVTIYNDKSDLEGKTLNTIANQLEEFIKGIEYDEGGDEFVNAKGLAKAPTTITTDETNIQIVIPKGFAPVLLTGSSSTSSTVNQNGSVASIMPYDTWNTITAEQIKAGVVIVDNAITYDGGNATGTVPDFNEYVWVSIPSSDKFARTAWTTSKGYNSAGIWTENGSITHLLAETPTEFYYWDDKSSIEYINMNNSVNTNKGFYVSRYEASADSTSTVAQSKRGRTPWTSVTVGQAIEYSANNTASKNMHLLYGVEWDSMFNWLIGNAKILSSTSSTATKTMTRADVETDSTTWGNLVEVFWQVPSQQRTGTREAWKANNIYDIAGNVWEWTQECYSIGTSKTFRGGNHFSFGDSNPPARRDVGGDTLTNGSGGFRYGFFV